ncbi:hypothetical protein [Pacificoceanicola onchidii]|uniref:hypothetical protein n=1 Tax=Pacificoceanicola onchidii TaxID=2562685 RepID=UPI0010A51F12|nr:hypothetical protein [Pacificoceanicola onchidii]
MSSEFQSGACPIPAPRLMVRGHLTRAGAFLARAFSGMPGVAAVPRASLLDFSGATVPRGLSEGDIGR